MAVKPKRFVDAHMHLWDLRHLRYPWLTPPFSSDGVNGDVSSIAGDYLLDDYLQETRDWNVAGIVHVEAGADPDDALAETRWLEQSATGRGIGLAIVAFCALDDPAIEEKLAAQCEHPHVRGIRHIANWHDNARYTYTPADMLQDAGWRHGLTWLRKYGLSFDLQIYPGQMADAARLAAENPDVRIILDHGGMPVDRDASGLEAWSRGIRLLAAQPNVSVKLSGFGIVDHDWTEASIRPFVLGLIDAFGVDRCMFASDIPTDRLYASLDRILSAYMALSRDLSEDERDKLFAANAARLYRIRPGD